MLYSFMIIATFSTLGLYIAFQGKNDEAGPLFGRSLAIMEPTQDSDQSKVAASLEYEAKILRAQVIINTAFSHLALTFQLLVIST